MKQTKQEENPEYHLDWTKEEVITFISNFEEFKNEQIPLTEIFVRICNFLVNKNIVDVWIFCQYYFPLKEKDSITVDEVIHGWKEWLHGDDFLNASFDVHDISFYENLFFPEIETKKTKNNEQKEENHEKENEEENEMKRNEEQDSQNEGDEKKKENHFENENEIVDTNERNEENEIENDTSK